MNRLSLVKTLFALMLGVIGLSGAAQALSLDEAKAKGLVGEKRDGYLGVVVESQAVKRLVNEINSARRAKYEEIAKRNGTSLQAVEALAAKRAIDITPAGQFIELPSGGWGRKS